MNRTDLSTSIPLSAGVSATRRKAIVDDILSSIQSALRRGEKVELKGFGTFSIVETKERPGRNVRTGEAITIPAGRKAKFKASAGLLNGG